MEEKTKLVLAGERSLSQAISKSPTAVILSVIVGALFISLPLVIGFDQRAFFHAFGIDTGRFLYTAVNVICILGGIFFVVIGLLYPFLLSWGMKQIYIDVYEDRICGNHEENRNTVPFELTYDKIENIHADVKKHAIYIETAGKTLKTNAFNGQEIVKAVNARRK